MNSIHPSKRHASPSASAASHADGGSRLSLMTKQLWGAALLAPVFLGVYYLAYWLRFEGQIGPEDHLRFTSTVGLVVLVKLAVFTWFGIYRGWRRLVTFYDLVALIRATTAGMLVLVLVNHFMLRGAVIPRSIFLLDWGATIVVIGGTRSLWRGFREYNWAMFLPSDQIPAFIVGANDTGEFLLRAIIRNGNRTYRVVGFIDGTAQRLGTRIAGVPVIGILEETSRLAERHGVQEVLVVREGLSGRQIRQLVDEARQHGIEVRVLPSLEQMLSGRVAIQPQPVAIDDLLRRDPVALDLESIRRWIDHRVLLVTGSAGSIGSEICRQLLQFAPRRIVMVDRSETGQFFLERELRELRADAEIDVCLADVLDRPRMRDILRRNRPHVIFHAAAYKHVPLMETHPGEAVKNIVLATRQLADLAVECGTDSFVLISTDKAVNPTSMMGACKRVAELYVQAMAGRSPCRFVTVRFGNVLDSAGSVVQIFRRQIAGGGPVTVTDPAMRRYFMTIPEAARLVIQAGAIGSGGHVLLLDMGEPIRIVDLAADMIRLSGLKAGEDVAIEFVGPRPGEKLFEELHTAGESHLPTCHPKIIVVDHKPAGFEQVVAGIDQLDLLADASAEQIALQLQRIVPEYRSPSYPVAGARRAAA